MVRPFRDDNRRPVGLYPGFGLDYRLAQYHDRSQGRISDHYVGAFELPADYHGPGAGRRTAGGHSGT